MTINPRRALLSVVVTTAALLLTLLLPGLAPWSPAAADTTVPAGICNVHFYALDAGKESPYAFGPAITPRDEAGIKAELHESRICGKDLLGDPTLTAAHYAEWSQTGLTTQKIEYAGIDAFAAQLTTNFPLWESVVTEMEGLESASAFSLSPVPAGTPSLYMVPNGTGGVTTHQGATIGEGTAATFTHPNGAVVKFRLECHFQDVRPEFPGVPPVPPGTPETPPPPTTPPAPCPPGEVVNVNGKCVVPKSSDPTHYRQPGDGGKGADVGTGTKSPVTVTTPAEAAPPSVVTSVPGGGGAVDTSTSAPTSEAGVPASGADPAPATASPAPSNEGGSNNGVVSGP